MYFIDPSLLGTVAHKTNGERRNRQLPAEEGTVASRTGIGHRLRRAAPEAGAEVGVIHAPVLQRRRSAVKRPGYGIRPSDPASIEAGLAL
jgi:hypothetical protein